MSKNPVLGATLSGAPVTIDVDRLVESRALLCANSGGGKSWLLRRMLEQTFGRVQQIVIDPEGEFFTLREKFDLVLAGKHGDCPADVRSAALLARRLLELGTSAILDLSDLLPSERVRFVRLFVDGLMAAPRDLQHPVLVVIDEAHRFAPETGRGEKPESSNAIAELMSAGRKRGLAGVLATQRLSKLSKDVAAEANNVIIGRATLDLDVRRCADSIGMSPSDAKTTLRQLEPGHFYAFGPAISRDVVELVAGPVTTTHRKVGERVPRPVAPREAVRKTLAKLADLPKEAAEEARSIDEARKQIAELRREIAAAKKAAPAPKEKRVEVPVLAPKTAEILAKAAGKLAQDAQLVAAASKDVLAALARVPAGVPLDSRTAHLARPEFARGGVLPASSRAGGSEGGREVTMPVPRRMPIADPRPPSQFGDSSSYPRASSRAAHAQSAGNAQLGRAERSLLTVLAQRDVSTAIQLAVLSGYSKKSSTFTNALGALRSQGLAVGGGDAIRITDAGRAALGPVEPLPKGRALVEYWLGKVSKAESALLRALLEAGPQADLTNEQLAERSGYSVTSSSFTNALGALRTLELAVGYGAINASPVLLEAAA